MLPDRFILLDTEQSTRDEHSMPTNWSRPGDYREVIQFGALEILRPEYVANRYFERLAKPTMNPFLSKHIRDLTGITSERMRKEGVPLLHALRDLDAFCGNLPIYAFGEDGGVIHANCHLVGIQCPIPFVRFHDIRPILRPLCANLGINMDGYSSGTLLHAFGLQGKRPHDALNDVTNLTIALQELHIRGRL